MALHAVECAHHGPAPARSDVLMLLDFSRPSTEKRLWVFDLERNRLVFEELVSHGQGSGGNVPERFSNTPRSHMSSLGVFLTGETYHGKHGYSLRLRGLEKGFNDKSFERAIVIHPAPYVSAEFAGKTGRLGRSHGCPAVRPAISRQLIDTVRGGAVLFAYYPDEAWLQKSAFVGCATARDSLTTGPSSGGILCSHHSGRNQGRGDAKS
jgi:hypothetical protein